MADSMNIKVKLDASDVKSSGGGLSGLFGGGKKSGGKSGGGGLGGMKGLAGIAKIATGVGAALAVLGGIKKLAGSIVKSSPRLQQILAVMAKSFMLILRPIGDVIANFLRPMAIGILRFLIKRRKESKKAAADGEEGAENSSVAGAKIEGQQDFITSIEEAGGVMSNFTGIIEAGMFVWNIFSGSLEMLWGSLKIIGAILYLVGAAIVWLVSIALEPFMWILTPLGEAIVAMGAFMSDIGTAIWDLATGGSWDAFMEAISAIWNTLVENFKKIWAGLWDALSKKWGDAFTKFKDGWTAVWEGIKTVFMAMGEFFTTWLIDPIKNAFRTVVDSIVGFIQGILNKLPKFLGGGGGEAEDKPRAKGGDVVGGQSYLVGEKGPETFTPNGGGSISPNGAGGGGSVTINVNAMDAGSIDSGIISKIQSAVEEAMKRSTVGRTTEFSGVQ